MPKQRIKLASKINLEFDEIELEQDPVDDTKGKATFYINGIEPSGLPFRTFLKTEEYIIIILT